MPRRFQFGLRALLVGITLGCVLFGMKVEWARRRGHAIDDAVEAGCVIGYLDESNLILRHGERADHFWADLKGIPIYVSLSNDAWSGDSLKDAIASQLSRISGMSAIEFSLGVGTSYPASVADNRENELRRMFPHSAITQFVIIR